MCRVCVCACVHTVHMNLLPLVQKKIQNLSVCIICGHICLFKINNNIFYKFSRVYAYNCSNLSHACTHTHECLNMHTLISLTIHLFVCICWVRSRRVHHWHCRSNSNNGCWSCLSWVQTFCSHKTT